MESIQNPPTPSNHSQNSMVPPQPPPLPTTSHFDNSTNTNVLSYANVSALIASPNMSLTNKVSSSAPPNPSQKPSKNFNKNPNKKPDYSDDNLKTPKKDQGLIIESVDGLKIKQYLKAVGEIIGAENIIYASRLSRDRICLYLKSKDLINEITQNFDNISIDEHNLYIRPLMLRATKYYLNRVCPSIPSSYLHDKISEIGINITSMIQREKMSNDEGEFSHIFSFRRTFYGIPEKNTNIPESILLNFDQEQHRIFLSTEIKRCTNCHKIGHLVDVCRQKENVDNTTQHVDNDNISESQNISSLNSALHLSSSSLNTENNDMEMIDISSVQDKTNKQSTQLQLSQQNENKKNSAPSKTPKINAEGSYAELEKSYERVITSHLSFEYFLSFVVKLSKKEIDHEEIRKQYTKDIKELTQISETLRGVTVSGTKARLTRTLFKIKNIFKYQNQKSNQLQSDEFESSAMELVQFSSTN